MPVERKALSTQVFAVLQLFSERSAMGWWIASKGTGEHGEGNTELRT